MPIQLMWDNAQKNIIRIDLTSPWTWQEYDLSLLESNEMLRSVEHRVDIIIDMRQSGNFPERGSGTQHVKRGRDMRPNNYGITVSIGADIIAKATLNAGTTLGSRARQTLFFVDTIEEAYEVIGKERKFVSSNSDKETPQEENDQSTTNGQ